MTLVCCCSQQLNGCDKSSLAAALRHSTRQAQQIYDPCTANERKRLAVEIAREFVEGSQLDSGMATQPSEASYFQLGDFMACVDKSAVNAPKTFSLVRFIVSRRMEKSVCPVTKPHQQTCTNWN